MSPILQTTLQRISKEVNEPHAFRIVSGGSKKLPPKESIYVPAENIRYEMAVRVAHTLETAVPTGTQTNTTQVMTLSEP